VSVVFVCLNVYNYVCLYVCISFCQSVMKWVSICWLFIKMKKQMWLFINLSACLSVCIYGSFSFFLSFFLFLSLNLSSRFYQWLTYQKNLALLRIFQSNKACYCERWDGHNLMPPLLKTDTPPVFPALISPSFEDKCMRVSCHTTVPHIDCCRQDQGSVYFNWVSNCTLTAAPYPDSFQCW